MLLRDESVKVVRSYGKTDETLEKSIEYLYHSFQTLFLKINDDTMYNLNGHQIYQTNSEADSNIVIEKPFKNILDENEIEYNDDTTIPKVLKLQKKFK